MFANLLHYTKLSRHVFGLEFRKIVTYRVDFWSGFLGSTVAEIAVAYFLWKSIFDFRGITELNGFSFAALILYYVISSLLSNITQAQNSHAISDEIYQGAVNRYIVYPLPFLYSKAIAHLSVSIVGVVQLLFALGVYFLIFGVPEGVQISPSSIALGMTVALFGAFLYFLMSACLEMVAFWADNVWSLVVMLRFATRLGGGALMPLAFFPQSSQALIKLTPFYVAAALPIEVTMGRLSHQEVVTGICVMAFWIICFIGVSGLIWRRGCLKYTGVGI